MQNSDSKIQSDKAKFKIEFKNRLIQFSLSVIRLCNKIRNDRNLCPLADQLIRSGTSIGANIIEAKASSSKREYLRYFEISLKSANETEYWLILAKESCPNIQKEIDGVLSESREISKIIASGIMTMKDKKII